MLRGRDGTRLDSFRRAAGTVRGYRDDGSGLQRAHNSQQSDFTTALCRATYGAIAPSLGEVCEILAIAVPADEDNEPLSPVQREEREEAGVPEHEDERGFPLLDAAFLKAPGRPRGRRRRARPVVRARSEVPRVGGASPDDRRRGAAKPRWRASPQSPVAAAARARPHSRPRDSRDRPTARAARETR